MPTNNRLHKEHYDDLSATDRLHKELYDDLSATDRLHKELYDDLSATDRLHLCNTLGAVLPLGIFPLVCLS